MVLRNITIIFRIGLSNKNSTWETRRGRPVYKWGFIGFQSRTKIDTAGLSMILRIITMIFSISLYCSTFVIRHGFAYRLLVGKMPVNIAQRPWLRLSAFRARPYTILFQAHQQALYCTNTQYAFIDKRTLSFNTTNRGLWYYSNLCTTRTAGNQKKMFRVIQNFEFDVVFWMKKRRESLGELYELCEL